MLYFITGRQPPPLSEMYFVGGYERAAEKRAISENGEVCV